jgi:hypothetical protein
VVLVEFVEAGKVVETSTREPLSDEVVVADAACLKPVRQSLELLRIRDLARSGASVLAGCYVHLDFLQDPKVDEVFLPELTDLLAVMDQRRLE